MQGAEDKCPLIEKVTDIQRLKAILLTHDKVIIHFAGAWSEASKNFEPVLQTFAEIYINIQFISIDADEHEELALNADEPINFCSISEFEFGIAQEYEIDTLPTFVLINKGKVVDKQQGTDTDFLNSRIIAHFE